MKLDAQKIQKKNQKTLWIRKNFFELTSELSESFINQNLTLHFHLQKEATKSEDILSQFFAII